MFHRGFLHEAEITLPPATKEVRLPKYATLQNGPLALLRNGFYDVQLHIIARASHAPE